ncbi:MAG: tyrosine--tRNA ligase, partial [Lachnospira sp.]|nr:tyrosine--tRNA ligase [Lachnospira sp.]
GAVDVITLVCQSGLATSRSEARRAVEQGGVSVNGEKVAAIDTTFAKELFEGDGVVVKKGKKSFRKVTVK